MIGHTAAAVALRTVGIEIDEVDLPACSKYASALEMRQPRGTEAEGVTATRACDSTMRCFPEDDGLQSDSAATPRLLHYCPLES